ncbi:MAG TPA: response regulator [Candidatus Barnesiella merdipullorum]|nr:response regulator [Candidatus Barnesiella merdipullorum]
MTSYSRKATRNKALWGYLLLVAVLLASSWFVYHEISLLVAIRDVEQDMSAKRHRVSDALSSLYRTETLGQSLVWGRYSDYPTYREKMNEVVTEVDSLRSITTDSVQLSRIDSIVYLLNRKNTVIRRLMSTSIDVAEEQNRKIENMMRQQDSLLLIHKYQQALAQQSDSLVEKHRKRNVFGRIADAISGKSPVSLDSIRVESKRIGALSDSLASDLKAMESGYHESRELSKQALERERWRLRNDNQRLSGQISRLMNSFEQEQLLVSERILDRNEAIRQESMNTLLGVTSGAIVLAVIFGIMVWRGWMRDDRWRRELEEARRRAEELLEAREKLMLTITHDFKAPLSSIIGYVELMMRLDNSERQRFYLQNMKASSDHLLALVSDLLDFYRLESHKLDVNHMTFNPKALFEKIVSAMQPVAEKKQLKLILKAEPSANASFSGDPLRIQQIVDNLLSNALKFTTRGTVTVHVFVRVRFLVFSVSDTGRGIARDDLEQIFQAFTRLSSAQGVEGFGLGLTITRQLVDLMHGRLDVRSREGVGSTFTVEIPLDKVADEVVSPAFSWRRCLLLDDDKIQLTLFENQLKQLGMEAVACMRAEEVLGYLEHEPFDVVFTDMQMPEMNGVQFLKFLRASAVSQARSIPVVVVTARSDSDRLQAEGFARVLRKPFSLAQLADCLSAIGYETQGRVVQPVSEAEAVASSGRYDFSPLTAFAGDDRAACHNILTTFLQELTAQIDELKMACEKHDGVVVTRIAHKWQPIFAMLKLSDMLPLLSRVEEEGTEAWTDTLAGHLTRLLACAGQIRDELQSILKKEEQR